MISAAALAAITQLSAPASAQAACFCLRHIASQVIPFFDCKEQTVRSRGTVIWNCRGPDGETNPDVAPQSDFEKVADGIDACRPCEGLLGADGRLKVPRGVEPILATE